MTTTIDMVEFRRQQHQHIVAARIPARFQVAIELDPGVAAWASAYAESPATAKSLLLAGPTGTGKTHQAYRSIAVAGQALADRGLLLQWIATSHPDLNAAQRGGEDIRRYMDIDLLFLDDVGAGKQTEWTGDVLYRLVDHRWSHGKITIYATNHTPDQLDSRIGDRALSRLAAATMITVKGVDRRWDENR